MANGTSEEHAVEPVRPSVASGGAPAAESSAPQAKAGAPAAKRPLWMWIVGGVLVVLILYAAIPRGVLAFKKIYPDDAFVDGHVTFVAPRVHGYVVRVLVDDNNRVHKGDLLAQLDKEPYQVKVDIAQASVGVAQSDLLAAQAKAQSPAEIG